MENLTETQKNIVLEYFNLPLINDVLIKKSAITNISIDELKMTLLNTKDIYNNIIIPYNLYKISMIEEIQRILPEKTEYYFSILNENLNTL